MKKYVVSYSCGQYDDSSEGPIGVYDTREDAQKFIETEKSWKREMRKLAIRDLESWEPGFIEFSEDDQSSSNYYSNLLEEYREWLWKIAMGDKSEDELTEEDYRRYDDFMEDEWLPKFMKEKGYSGEVIEATIAINDYSDYSRYNTHYYIKEVPYYPEA